MTSATATYPETVSYPIRLPSFSARVILNHLVLCIAAVAAVCGTATIVTGGAAWIVAASLSGSSSFHTKVPAGLERIAMADPFRPRADVADATDASGVLTDPIRSVAATPEPQALLAAAPASAPTSSALLLQNRTLKHADSAPATPSRALEGPHSPAKREAAVSGFGRTVPQPATAATPSLPPASQKTMAMLPAPKKAFLLPDADSHTAIYDIVAHTVYLPNGQRLEAHSGVGKRLDDPHFVGEKNRGPTPPNAYDLVLRGQLFHGVRAIRLNPVGDAKMYGRDGILAHTYMLGPTGQSFGCVSFKDYPAFLRAFQKGEVDRMIVVPHLASTPTPVATLTQGGNSRKSAVD